jgi:L,D-transpeptidase YbiS
MPFIRSASIGGGSLLLLVAIGLAGTGYTWKPYPGSPGADEAPGGAGGSSAGSGSGPGGVAGAGVASAVPVTKQERAERRRLEAELRRIAPGGVYVVVDSANNRLWVRRGERILVDAVVSTGSGLVLRQVDADRTWTFDTPKGMYRIHRRAENPVWIKPDWAFLEDGEPVPSRHSERFDYGALGEYGLYFGDAYLIHGTLYENLLGRSVSHGCIRVGRENLRKIWMLCPLGTPVILF